MINNIQIAKALGCDEDNINLSLVKMPPFAINQL